MARRCARRFLFSRPPCFVAVSCRGKTIVGRSSRRNGRAAVRPAYCGRAGDKPAPGMAARRQWHYFRLHAFIGTRTYSLLLLSFLAWLIAARRPRRPSPTGQGAGHTRCAIESILWYAATTDGAQTGHYSLFLIYFNATVGRGLMLLFRIAYYIR